MANKDLITVKMTPKTLEVLRVIVEEHSTMKKRELFCRVHTEYQELRDEELEEQIREDIINDNTMLDMIYDTLIGYNNAKKGEN